MSQVKFGSMLFCTVHTAVCVSCVCMCAMHACVLTIQYNTISGWFSAQPTTELEQLGITMLISDKSQLKRNIKQIGLQIALKTSKSLSWSNRLRQTVPYWAIKRSQRSFVCNFNKY